MAEFKGVNSTIVDGTTGAKVHVSDVGGRVRCFHEELTTVTGHVSGSTLMMGVLPKGARIIGLLVTASATLGSSVTLSWGTRATAAGSTLDADAIAAAATHTVTVPTWIGTSATSGAGVAMGEKLAAESYIIATVADEDLAATKLIVDTFYQLD